MSSINPRDHAMKRFWERYGVMLTPEIEADIKVQIETGEAVHIMTQRARMAIFHVLVGNVRIPIVFDVMIKKIITALPEQELG